MAKEPDLVSLKKIIEAKDGDVRAVAKHFRTTRQTIYAWIKKHNLRSFLDDARTDTHSVADDVIYSSLQSPDEKISLKAAMFVKQNYPLDGVAIVLPSAVRANLIRMGISIADLTQHLIDLAEEEAQDDE